MLPKQKWYLSSTCSYSHIVYFALCKYACLCTGIPALKTSLTPTQPSNKADFLSNCTLGLRAWRQCAWLGAGAGGQEAGCQRGQQRGRLSCQAPRQIRRARGPARQPGQRVCGVRAPVHPGRQPREQACRVGSRTCQSVLYCSPGATLGLRTCKAGAIWIELRYSCEMGSAAYLGRRLVVTLRIRLASAAVRLCCIICRLMTGAGTGFQTDKSSSTTDTHGSAPAGRFQAGSAANSSPGAARPSAAAQLPNSSACASAAFQATCTSSATAARSCASARGPASAHAASGSPWRCRAACGAHS